MNNTSRGLRFFGDRQSLHSYALVSLLIHLFFFSIAFFILRGNDHYILPSSYVVNLVSPESTTISLGSKKEEFPSKGNIRDREVKRSDEAVKDKHGKAHFERDEQLISERIAAIMAKKRIEKIASLRNTISLQGGAAGKKGIVSGSGEKKGASLVDDYYSRITSEIKQHWIYPDTGSKDIEAEIVIKILKDGSVQIRGVEKSSGNSLFDRSAIRAITKASPLTPPPYEMEIGVRFHP